MRRGLGAEMASMSGSIASAAGRGVRVGTPRRARIPRIRDGASDAAGTQFVRISPARDRRARADDAITTATRRRAPGRLAGAR